VPIGLTVALAVLLTLDDGSATVRVIDNIAVLGASTYATVCAALATRFAEGRARTAWATMTAALACWAVGDLIWVLCEFVLNRRPFPSAADVFYLAAMVLVAAAMAQFRTEPSRQSRLRMFLDGATVALCSFLLAWILVLNGVYEAYRHDRLALGIAIAYPAVDLIALAVAVAVIARAGVRQRAVLAVLTLAIALIAISDSAFAYLVADGRYSTGSLLDAGWAAALVTFGAAALLSRRTLPQAPPTLSPPTSSSSLWLPYVPLMFAGTVGPLMVMSGFERILVPFIMIAVCLRQMVAASENRRLLTEAAEQALRDPLTGLANRTLFQDRLAHSMLLRSRDDDRSVAVVSLDLDDFKLVNDSLGHPAADDLLVHAGHRVAE
jgi:predicted signal transduction protein with EAL and GGDEF domain